MDILDARLTEVLALHFDPHWGAPWWLTRAKVLAIDLRAEIASIRDLERLGPFPLDELSVRSVTDFIPRRYHHELSQFVSSETGGTTGPPKRTAFFQSEFEAAFVTPFLAAAELMNFPRDCNWLFIGPTGPHIIGKAARACARAMGSIDPFMVDFDPRWVRKLPPDSLAHTRYVEHVIQQCLHVLHSQTVEVLFATPPILEVLAARLSVAKRQAIRGVHLGGMRVAGTIMERLHVEWFPNAVALSGYGNSLVGLCPQVADDRDVPRYFAHGNRMVVEIAPEDVGCAGHVRYHRLDDSVFLPNLIERDVAEACPLPVIAEGRGFHSTGLSDPRPPANAPQDAIGIY